MQGVLKVSEINSQLDSNIPKDVITTRSQSGKNLSYLESWYVIDRLNQVLGTENWSHEIINILPLASEKPSYGFHVRLTARINGVLVSKDGIGYGSDKSNFNAGEMALKEAESDALKRAAMKLGRSLGLALYDKSQEFVGEALQEFKTELKAARAEVAVKQSDTKALRSQIKSIFKILQSQKKIEAADFTAKYLAGDKVDTLEDVAVNSALNSLKADFPEFA